MRKLEILTSIVLISGLSLTSCQNDDDTSKTASIIGKWNFSTQRITTTTGTLINEGPYEGNEASCSADYLQFFEDHTAATGDYDENCELELVSSTYIRDEKDLTLSYGPVSSTDYRILTANETTLVLENRYKDGGTTLVAEVRFVKA